MECQYCIHEERCTSYEKFTKENGTCITRIVDGRSDNFEKGETRWLEASWNRYTQGSLDYVRTEWEIEDNLDLRWKW